MVSVAGWLASALPSVYKMACDPGDHVPGVLGQLRRPLVST
jgi:hypothetical protein